MKELLANRFVSRFIGSLGAGAASYVANPDWKAALITAATFFAYGAAHAQATNTGEKAAQ